MTGIDVPIKKLTDAFTASLWPTVTNKQFNGRCFRNERNSEVIPEVLISGTNDYREVLFDDKLNALCFFDADDTIENVNDEPIQEVRLIFAVNLKAIYPTLAYRATEEVHKAVLDIIKRNGQMQFQLQRIETGLSAYGNLSTERLKSYNMQPWYTFAIVMNIIHSYQCQF